MVGQENVFQGNEASQNGGVIFWTNKKVKIDENIIVCDESLFTKIDGNCISSPPSDIKIEILEVEDVVTVDQEFKKFRELEFSPSI